LLINNRHWNETARRLTGGSMSMNDMMRRRWRLLLVPVILIILLVAACSDTSSNFPIARAGNILDITVLDLERLPELRYSNVFQGRVVNHFRVTSTQEGSELVLLRVRVGNHTAVTAIVTVDEQAAQLGDFFEGVFLPQDVEIRGEGWIKSDTGWGWVSNSIAKQAPTFGEQEEVPDPPGWKDGPVRSIELQAGGGAPPGQGFLVGSFQLPRDFSIDGWMMFEAPKGTNFRELRWRAGDSIIIPF
jgi:hypothetical protein